MNTPDSGQTISYQDGNNLEDNIMGTKRELFMIIVLFVFISISFASPQTSSNFTQDKVNKVCLENRGKKRFQWHKDRRLKKHFPLKDLNRTLEDSWQMILFYQKMKTLIFCLIKMEHYTLDLLPTVSASRPTLSMMAISYPLNISW